jgi:hypothetical protein
VAVGAVALAAALAVGQRGGPVARVDVAPVSGAEADALDAALDAAARRAGALRDGR